MLSDVRINKFLSERGLCSRRQADKFIQEGQVRINGRIAVLGDVVADGDEVKLEGKPVPKAKSTFLLLAYNKPEGIECTTDTRVDGNIIDAIKYPERIFPIGRLDKNSEGLILLTNDGDIVNKILRRARKHEKEYWVRVDKALKDTHLKIMERGMDIGDSHKTLPCEVTRQSSRSVKMVLMEGRNRQIRRMLRTFGHRVEKLKRVRICNILLRGLERGKLRKIENKELQDFLKIIGHELP